MSKNVRVTATVPEATLEVWRDTAEALGQSTSSLIAEWMTELVPGLRDVARLRRAFEAADEAQRGKIRASLLEAGELAQETLLSTWDPVRSAIPDAEDGLP